MISSISGLTCSRPTIGHDRLQGVSAVAAWLSALRNRVENSFADKRRAGTASEPDVSDRSRHQSILSPLTKITVRTFCGELFDPSSNTFGVRQAAPNGAARTESKSDALDRRRPCRSGAEDSSIPDLLGQRASPSLSARFSRTSRLQKSQGSTPSPHPTAPTLTGKLLM